MKALAILLLVLSCVEKCEAPKRAGCHTTVTVRCMPVINGRIITMVCPPQEETVCDINACASQK